MKVLWHYIPAKVETFVCNIVALNYRSFLHSNIQLLQFNITHSQFNVHNSNATLFEHATVFSMFNVFIWCKMRYAHNAIQHSCFLLSQSISMCCFLRLTCNIRVFQCNVDTRCVCCGAECDMPATQSNILLCPFTIQCPYFKCNVVRTCRDFGGDITP